MNDKYKDYLRRAAGYFAVVLVSLCYIGTAFIRIGKTGKAPSEILSDGAMVLLLGLFINRIFDLQGMMLGERDERLCATVRLHGETVSRLSPVLHLLPAWCAGKNRENLRECRRRVLALRGLRYEAYFAPDGSLIRSAGCEDSGQATGEGSLPGENAPAGDENPPARDENPPGRDENPSARDQNPPARDQNPPGRDQNPPGREKNLPAGDQNLPGRDENPPGRDENLPGRDENSLAREKRRAARREARADRRCVRRALRLRPTPLSPGALTAEGGRADDPFRFGRTKKSYEAGSSLRDLLTKILMALLFGYYGVELLQDFSPAELIFKLFQVALFLLIGVTRMLQTYFFMTDEYRSRLIKKIDLLQMFENAAAQETDTTRT